MALRLDIEFQSGGGVECYRNCLHDDSSDKADCAAEYGDDISAATRRAIVRAAAAMAEQGALGAA